MGRRAAILLQRFLRDEKCDHFSLGHFDAGKTRDGFGVDESEIQLIVFDRQPELVAHEVDVPLHGLGRDFELVGQLPTIGKTSRLELLVVTRFDFGKLSLSMAPTAARTPICRT